MRRLPSFVIFGLRASGKDTLTEMLIRKTGFKQLALSKYVHNACHAFGIDNPTKADLVFIGTEIGRKLIDNEIWLKMAKKEVITSPDQFIVSDARFHNEYELFVGLGFFPIWVDTEKETCIARAIARDGSIDLDILDHPSENNYKEFVGWRIDNNGTVEDLEKQVDELLDLLKDEEFAKMVITDCKERYYKRS